MDFIGLFNQSLVFTSLDSRVLSVFLDPYIFDYETTHRSKTLTSLLVKRRPSVTYLFHQNIFYFNSFRSVPVLQTQVRTLDVFLKDPFGIHIVSFLSVSL